MSLTVMPPPVSLQALFGAVELTSSDTAEGQALQEQSRAKAAIPERIDPEALRKALREARMKVPAGEYH